MTSMVPPSGRAVVVLGATGQIGFELCRALMPVAPVHGLSRDDLDLSDCDAAARKIRELRPAAVINAAAYTAVDRAEQEAETAMRINADAPGILARACMEAGAVFIHYSTDYVFDGRANRAYTELDEPTPLNVYGASKRAGELNVLEAAAASIVLRTSWIYAARGHNFLRTMLQLAHSRKTVRVVDDQYGCPTPARYVAEATIRILTALDMSPEQFSSVHGIYHLSAGGRTTWCGFAREIFSVAGCADVEVEPVATAEYPTPAARPANSVLDTTLVQERFGLYVPDWRSLVRLTLAECGESP